MSIKYIWLKRCSLAYFVDNTVIFVFLVLAGWTYSFLEKIVILVLIVLAGWFEYLIDNTVILVLGGIVQLTWIFYWWYNDIGFWQFCPAHLNILLMIQWLDFGAFGLLTWIFCWCYRDIGDFSIGWLTWISHRWYSDIGFRGYRSAHLNILLIIQWYWLI